MPLVGSLHGIVIMDPENQKNEIRNKVDEVKRECEKATQLIDDLVADNDADFRRRVKTR